MDRAFTYVIGDWHCGGIPLGFHGAVCGDQTLVMSPSAMWKAKAIRHIFGVPA